MTLRSKFLWLMLCWLNLIGGIAYGATANVAVAANFVLPMQKLTDQFEHDSGHRILIASGSTGKFVAQIRSGAPFDILLSADQVSCSRLGDAAIASSEFTYAIGTLVLWSADASLVDAQGAVLNQGRFAHLAIAAPELAPYGAAAMQTLRALKLDQVLAAKLVQGESIGQTFAFVSSGNAELGFVALSQVWENNQLKSGSAWIVPPQLYAPLRQDAVLLQHGQENPAALAFLAYLKTEPARAVMRAFGYHF